MSKKDNYVIFNPEGGLGKIIASTAVVRSIHEKYPKHKIIVLTPWPEIYLNNPRIHRVYKTGATPYFYKDYIAGRESIILKGEPYYNTDHLYGKQHLVKSWCELYGLPFDGNTKPEIYFTVNEIDMYKDMTKRDKPTLVMQTNGGMYENGKIYSWTRDIPYEQSQILANELSKQYHILHIGSKNSKTINNTESYNNIPNKRSLIGILIHSSKRLLIDSCMQHAAAALDLESTVCWVATDPNVFGYEIHDNIKPVLPFRETSNIDSLFFDYDFNGPEHEYPFESADIFNLQEVYNSVVK